jgi:hypothetical protein
MEADNPVTMFYCWQALVQALAISGIVQFVKVLLDTYLGEERRKANKLVTRVVLPVLGALFGALLANLMPIRPELLTEYVTVHKESWNYPALGTFLTYGGWGAAVGQFADHIYTKVKKMLEPPAKEPGA